MSLRRSLAIGSLTLGAASLTVCGVLVWSTGELEEINHITTRDLESIRLAEEAKIDLLVLAGHTRRPARDDEIAADLRSKLKASRTYVTTAGEQRWLDKAEVDVEKYLAGRAETGPASNAAADQAYATVDSLIAINSRETAEEFQRARDWDRRSNVLGWSVGALLLCSVIGFLLWLERRGVRPLFAISDAMVRFGRGDRSARAAEEGPAELRDMAVRFNEMATALASQRDAQMTFLAGVAHDLKNPLSVLKMSSDLARRSESLPPELVRELAERTRRQVTRLERMIGDLLDVAKIEAGQLEIKLERHDVVELVRQSVELFEGVPSKHEITLTVPDRPVVLSCDALRIEQIVINLVSNALKYSPEASAVDVRVARSTSSLVIAVVDRGVGISTEDQKRLFEPFRRVGLSKEAVPGVGLGLFVVRRLVEAHGGRIDIESSIGAGSTFRVLLPLPRDAAARPVGQGHPVPA